MSYAAFAADTTWSDPGWELLLKLKEAGFNVEGPIYSHYAKVHIIRVMHDALMSKIDTVVNGICAKLPYAPVYLR